ncbi:bifunctional metallophosphatase/5'-nucleotidase [Sporosarcina sp. P37]|uniref:bifunctional metallophosphatase/5'-nucleotidase n=1 Tax=unclassified Sporosarcina TaxID=2647733 RepID=UPI000A17D0F1|nr:MULTISPECIES: bifunctional UDP-sugar hydrolase/5'-nucleotidase [unclassified Sporosarcina]ARK26176.1 bifunctional metallophosphatase/5'-nucleotidase [Sporosarcina sp. P37]
MEETVATIHIYHTNDVHSHFENWPQISRFLKQRKQQAEAKGEAVFLFDIGDHIDRSHPFTEGTEGKGNIELLNEAEYDTVTIGNNEGITMSKESLNALYEDAQFDVVLCNLTDLDGALPYWAKTSKILETADGVRIGITGATAPYYAFYEQLGWRVTEPHAALKEVANSLRPQCDVLICLSHLGINEDRLLAAERPEFDVILGGHTHHLLQNGEWHNDTLIAAAEKFGHYVGHIQVDVDRMTNQVLHMTAEVFPTQLMKRTEEDVAEVNGYLNEGEEALEVPVFYNPSALPQRLTGNSPLSSLFGRALLTYLDADCALFNAGIFLGSLDEGWVTKGDLHSLLPHPINPCLVRLDGEDLLTIYEQSLDPKWTELPIRGLGFRGTLMGSMIHEHLFLNSDGQLFAGNRLVEPGSTYTLATLDMFTFGYFFPLLKEAPKEYIMPEMLRDVLGWYGRKYFNEG